ncbi:hypothetical protein B0H15DRAFT_872655 [Mycena belliarum]|uniref:Uncharacterized protein n=1 Tax=Mycena belliarum TaxID=1033014 RepID=A0AAD6XHG7_9AGAR|nr:hypothetical protein B0H15DRAFT_872655 [Mycena belliae]
MVEIILPPRARASPPQDHAAGVAASVRLPLLRTGRPPMSMDRRVCRPAALSPSSIRTRVRMRTPAQRALQSSVPSSTRATMRTLLSQPQAPWVACSAQNGLKRHDLRTCAAEPQVLCSFESTLAQNSGARAREDNLERVVNTYPIEANANAELRLGILRSLELIYNSRDVNLGARIDWRV